MEDFNSTITSTCAALPLDSPNATDVPFYVDVGVRAVNVVIAQVYLILGNFLNILTLILITRYKHLHSLSFAIAAQIAICNITEACVVGFPDVINNIMGRWIFGSHICAFSALLRLLYSTVRGILFLTFSLDRFGAVFFPFVYPRYSRKIVTVLCFFSWMISLIFSLVPIPQLLDCYGLLESSHECTIKPSCHKNCRLYMNVWLYLLYFPPSLIAAALFVVLYVKGRKIRRKESDMLGLSNKTISDSDWRAMKTFSILFGSFLIVAFIPFLLILLLEVFEGVVGFLLSELVIILVNIVLVTDPIVILRNADSRQACKKLRSDFKEWYHSRKRRPRKYQYFMK